MVCLPNQNQVHLPLQCDMKPAKDFHASMYISHWHKSDPAPGPDLEYNTRMPEECLEGCQISKSIHNRSLFSALLSFSASAVFVLIEYEVVHVRDTIRSLLACDALLFVPDSKAEFV